MLGWTRGASIRFLLKNPQIPNECPSLPVILSLQTSSSLKVSIIIASFNPGAPLVLAIRSALAFDGVEKEVIVIDEGSSDKSHEVLESFGQSIRWEIVEPKGTAHAWNYGLQISRGELLQFMCSYEVLSPKKIALQAAAAPNQGGLVYSDWRLIFRTHDPEWEVDPLTVSGEPDEPLQAFIEGWSPDPLATLFRRSLLMKLGGWNEELRIGYGREMVSRVLLASAEMTYLPGSLAVRRLYGGKKLDKRQRQIALYDELLTIKQVESILESQQRSNEFAEPLAESYTVLARQFKRVDRSLYHQLLERAKDLRDPDPMNPSRRETWI